MKASLLRRAKEVYGRGGIDGVIWEVPKPVPTSAHRIKYCLVYVVDRNRLVGHDN